MSSITNLVPIRVDASSSNGSVHLIDSLLIDTKCLPVSTMAADLSLHSLVDANAAHLAESLISDAEVYGAVKSSKNNIGRLDLLGDRQLCQTVEDQIRKQLMIALRTDKAKLIYRGDDINQQIKSTDTSHVPNNNGVVRIKLHLRHENIAFEDDFDYDVNTSGIDGFDPFTIAKNIVEDLKLPTEFVTSITTSILEQIYGLQVPDDTDGQGGSAATLLDSKQDGSVNDIVKGVLSK